MLLNLLQLLFALIGVLAVAFVLFVLTFRLSYRQRRGIEGAKRNIVLLFDLENGVPPLSSTKDFIVVSQGNRYVNLMTDLTEEEVINLFVTTYSIPRESIKPRPYFYAPFAMLFGI